MEPATIAVVIFTGAFLGLCVWIEWNSRRRPASAEPVEPMEEALAVAEEEKLPENFRRKRRLRSRLNQPAMDNEGVRESGRIRPREFLRLYLLGCDDLLVCIWRF